MKTLIRGGTVLTLDRDDRVLGGEDVLVEDGRIARVGGRLTDADGPFDRVIDASRRLVMPGLVNAHFHCYDRFLRGMWEGLPLEMWILCASPIFNPRLGERALHIRSQLCAAEMVLSGTTSCVDNMHPTDLSPDLLGAQLQGYLDVGLRVCAAPMIWNRPFTQTMPFMDVILPAAERARLDGAPPSVNAIVDFHRRLVKDWDGREGRVHVALAPAGPQRCTDELLRAFAAASQTERRPIHSTCSRPRCRRWPPASCTARPWSPTSGTSACSRLASPRSTPCGSHVTTWPCCVTRDRRSPTTRSATSSC
jgi:cytosine/adenosine deaminase-related metal-dependent hydrolase